MIQIKYKKKLLKVLQKRKQVLEKRFSTLAHTERIEKFKQIRHAYKSYHETLLRQGKLPVKSTEKGFWGVSVCDEIFELFSKLNLSSYKNFVDIGSGDGRVVLIASLFTNATGIEYDQELLHASLDIKRKLDLPASFLKDDFYNHDLSSYDMVFSFPDEPLYRGLDQKLKSELKGKFVVYGPFLNTSKLAKQDSLAVNGSIFHVYQNS